MVVGVISESVNPSIQSINNIFYKVFSGNIPTSSPMSMTAFGAGNDTQPTVEYRIAVMKKYRNISTIVL